VELAKFARAEDVSIRRQLTAMERVTESSCEMLFR